MSNINKLKLINLSNYKEVNGNLIVIEFKKKKFIPKRIFQVYAGAEKIRGKHAHKKSQQLLICNFGEIEIKSTDGKISKTFTLDKPNKALLIPPMIWSELKYKKKISILTVVTDSFYSESDYIRNFKKFLKTNKIYN
jgi:hypothetical protein